MSTPAPAALARRLVRLSAEPASVGMARQVLREVLTEAGRTQWIEGAELAVSELVTNAVLHAHTDIEFTVSAYDSLVRVEVRDFSPVLPVQRNYDQQATTGRGMALVAAITHDHGISEAGAHGKTVWFTITGEQEARSEEDLLAAWEDADWDLEDLVGEAPETGRPEGGATVQLLGLPPLLWLAARQHHDALIRELVLYMAEHGQLDADVAATDLARATVSTVVVAALQASQAAGVARRVLPEGHPSPLPDVPEPLDLQLTIPHGVGPAFALMQDTLDAAERLAEQGQLLARPGLPEIIAIRDWACEQVTAQLAGVPATPWPGTDQEHFTREIHDRDSGTALTGWDVAVVRDSDRGVVAADDANRIIAVSGSLAEFTGWEVEDLVGRRVVTLIPPRLREAHVAGFTRHLTTGEAHVLDVPLTLPVLRRDGTEIDAHFMVQKAPTDQGHAVYLAWIEPVLSGES